MSRGIYSFGYAHSPHDESSEVFDDPWLWDLSPQEIADRWRQGAGADLTPKAE